MSAPAKFKQADVTRALQGVVAAKMQPGRVRIDALGAIVIDIASRTGPLKRDNDWDDVFDGTT